MIFLKTVFYGIQYQIRSLFFFFKESPKIKKYHIQELVNKGFTVIENFISSEECNQLLDDIDNALLTNQDKLYVDPSKSDQRLFFAEEYSDSLNHIYQNSEIRSAINFHEKSSLFSGFLLAAKITFNIGNLGSGEGWHRDRQDKIQTKALIYLCDVTEDNGPLEYIENSHKLAYIIKNFFRGVPFSSTRFSDEQVQKLASDHTQISANKGTLVIFNSRGIHRGAPLRNGTRYAITNYSWYNQAIPDQFIPYKK